MGNLVSSRYIMTCEVYDETQTQNAAGGVSRVWDYDNPTIIECEARSVVRRIDSMERFGATYQLVEYVQISSSEPISQRARIGNIKNKQTGQYAYDPETVFDVIGCAPVTAPYIGVSEYATTALAASAK